MLYPRESTTREVRELGGFWEFAKDKDNIGVKERWFENLPATRPIAVSASYNEQTADDDLWEYFGAVWYFKRFTCPMSWAKRRVVLRFGAVHYAARVWLDGRPVAKNRGGSLPFEVEIARRIVPGREVLLAVRVDNTLSRTTIPPALPWKVKGRPFEYHFDFLNMSGINRPVRLYSTPRTHVEDITVVPSISGARGVLSVNVRAAGGWDGMRLEVVDAEGSIVASKKTQRATANLTVEKCRFWSPDDPYLYTLKVSLLEKGEVADEYPLPVGVRTVALSGDRFLLNGKPVYFKGVSRHEDFPVIGRGMCEAVLVKDFLLMKWLNVNSFRTVHYPYAEEVLNLADRLGFMVIDETPAVGLNDWTHKVFRKGILDGQTRKVHMEMIERQYARDKNHPCVVMWSLANEPSSTEGSFTSYIRPLFKRIRELDPTRPASFVTAAPYNLEKAGDLCDVILVNRYYGWYIRVGQLNGIKETLSADLDGWKRRFNKPVIVTEFGADTIAGMHHQPPIIFSEEFQVEFLRRYTEVFDDKPFVIGEQVWVMCDFATKQAINRVGGNKKGLFTRAREPKMAAHFMRERWARK